MLKKSDKIKPQEQMRAREMAFLIFELLCATRMLGVQGTSHGANFSAAMGGVEALGMAFIEGAPSPIVFLAEDGAEPRAKPLLAALADDALGDNGWPQEYLDVLRESLSWAMELGVSDYEKCMFMAGCPHRDPPVRRTSREAQCARPVTWSMALDAISARTMSTARLARIAATEGVEVDPFILALLEAQQIDAASCEGADHSSQALRL